MIKEELPGKFVTEILVNRNDAIKGVSAAYVIGN